MLGLLGPASAQHLCDICGGIRGNRGAVSMDDDTEVDVTRLVLVCPGRLSRQYFPDHHTEAIDVARLGGLLLLQHLLAPRTNRWNISQDFSKIPPNLCWCTAGKDARESRVTYHETHRKLFIRQLYQRFAIPLEPPEHDPSAQDPFKCPLDSFRVLVPLSNLRFAHPASFGIGKRVLAAFAGSTEHQTDTLTSGAVHAKLM